MQNTVQFLGNVQSAPACLQIPGFTLMPKKLNIKSPQQMDPEKLPLNIRLSNILADHPPPRVTFHVQAERTILHLKDLLPVLQEHHCCWRGHPLPLGILI